MLEALNARREEIVAPLLDFGVIYLSDAMKLVKWNKSQGAFYRLITRMENDGIIKSKRYTNDNKKVIYLDKDIHLALAPDTPYLSSEILYHDASLSSVFCKFLELKNVVACEKIHQGHRNYKFDTGVFPDGIVLSRNDEYTSRIAIEVELTRKSKERYIKKFDEYQSETTLKFVIFFFNSAGVFNSYRHELEHYMLEKNISLRDSKIVLCYCPNFTANTEDFFNSSAYAEGEVSKLSSILNIDFNKSFKGLECNDVVH